MMFKQKNAHVSLLSLFLCLTTLMPLHAEDKIQSNSGGSNQSFTWQDIFGYYHARETKPNNLKVETPAEVDLYVPKIMENLSINICQDYPHLKGCQESDQKFSIKLKIIAKNDNTITLTGDFLSVVYFFTSHNIDFTSRNINITVEDESNILNNFNDFDVYKQIFVDENKAKMATISEILTNNHTNFSVKLDNNVLDHGDKGQTLGLLISQLPFLLAKEELSLRISNIHKS